MKPYKRKNSKSWYLKWKIYDANTGQWRFIEKSSGTTDYGQANDALKALRTASESIAAAAGQSMSKSHLEALIRLMCASANVVIDEDVWPPLHSALDDYMKDRKFRVSPRTLKAYKSYKKVFIEFAPVDAPLDWLTVSRASEWYNSLLNHYTPKSANERMRFISRFYERQIIELGYPANPFRGVERVGNNAGETLRRMPFTQVELLKLIHHLRSTHPEWARATMISAMAGTRLDDTLHIHSDMIQDGVLTYTQGKTKKTLSIPLVVPEWRQEIELVKGYICPKLRHGVVQTRSQEFVQLVSDAGIEQLFTTFKSGRKVARKTFHSLRHTLRTQIVSSGGSDAQADLILGHSAGQGKTYTHSELDATRATLGRVFICLNAPPTEPPAARV